MTKVSPHPLGIVVIPHFWVYDFPLFSAHDAPATRSLGRRALINANPAYPTDTRESRSFIT